MFRKNNAKRNEQSDLGFGSVVAGESRERLVNPDGTFNVRRKGLSFFTSLSLYHDLLSISWWKFILLASAGYFFINICFAFAYLVLSPGALGGPNPGGFMGDFLKAFFFSGELKLACPLFHSGKPVFLADRQKLFSYSFQRKLVLCTVY